MGRRRYVAGEFVKFDRVSCNPKPVAKSVPIIVGGHSEAAARRAGRLGDGFFPSIGAQIDTMPLLEVVRRSAEQVGREPAKLELILGCPGALPKSVSDPRAAVEERIAQGAGRLALPVTAFLPDLETRLARFGEEIIGLTRTSEAESRLVLMIGSIALPSKSCARSSAR